MMNTLADMNTIGQLFPTESFYKNSLRIYKLFVYKQLRLDENARKLYKHIKGFNNPNLSAQAKLITLQCINNGFSQLVSYHQTSELIKQRTKELIDSHLTIEGMLQDFHQLSV